VQSETRVQSIYSSSEDSDVPDSYGAKRVSQKRDLIVQSSETHRQVAVVDSLVLRCRRLRSIVLSSVAVLAGLVISFRSALLALGLGKLPNLQAHAVT
jgi:hypothetical protein